ncbi:hypothetical protein BDZ89DRAFT_1022654 [Hymenopellis radicata]|nr:hypothetical protein BDZ89DRAFT_1022654 [Hymenopellis radicata]
MTQNTLPLTRRMLEDLLIHLSNILTRRLQLVVHGGASMILHPGLEHIPTQRVSTMDIDYLYRGVLQEYGQQVAQELLHCIYKTSLNFPGLSADWMNSEADIALPTTQSPPYDPVYHASIQPNNISLHTIFTSPNKRLVLVSVTPFWGVALKLVRFTKYDMADICVLLRNGTRMRGIKWTADVVERWLRTECASMRYDLYPEDKIDEWQARIRKVVDLVEDAAWFGPQPTPSYQGVAYAPQHLEEQVHRPREDESRSGGRWMQGEWTEPDDSDSDSSDGDSERAQDLHLSSDQPIPPFVPPRSHLVPEPHRRSTAPPSIPYTYHDQARIPPPFIPPPFPNNPGRATSRSRPSSSLAGPSNSHSIPNTVPTVPHPLPHNVLPRSQSMFLPSHNPLNVPAPTPQFSPMPHFVSPSPRPLMTQQSALGMSHPTFGAARPNGHPTFGTLYSAPRSRGVTPAPSPVIPPRPQDSHQSFYSTEMPRLYDHSAPTTPFIPPAHLLADLHF